MTREWRLLRRVVIGTIALLVSTPVVAQQRFNFDLDVPEGRQSFWEIGDVGKAKVFAAELQIHEMRRDQQWYPSFTVKLGGEANAIQMRFSTDRRGNTLDTTYEEITRDANGAERLNRKNVINGWSVQRDRPFKLLFDWSQPGMLIIASDTEERARYRLEFAPKSLRVTASTGEIIGLSVLLGDAAEVK